MIAAGSRQGEVQRVGDVLGTHAGVRERYLGAARDLDVEKKALLLGATNHMDRLRVLFGEVGNNYRKLAEYMERGVGAALPAAG